MAITWTRHKMNTSATAADREAWYEENLRSPGWIQGYNCNNPENGSDALTIKPFDGTSCWSTIILHAVTSDSTVKPQKIDFYTIKGDSGSASKKSLDTSYLVPASAGGLYFDTARISNIDVLRICQSDPQPSSMITIVKETGVTDADGETGTLYLLSAPYKAYGTNPTNHDYGLLWFLSNKHPGITYRYEISTSRLMIQLYQDNIGQCTNAILNRFAACGMLSNIYAIDGMSTSAPVQGVEFSVSVNGHLSTFYSLGHGLCIREN